MEKAPFPNHGNDESKTQTNQPPTVSRTDTTEDRQRCNRLSHSKHTAKTEDMSGELTGLGRTATAAGGRRPGAKATIRCSAAPEVRRSSEKKATEEVADT
jgi:hypothetical protein